jgi:hypothetical protein
MGKWSAVVELFLGDMGSMQWELRPSIQREDQPTMEELSLKVGDGGNREGGISWGCLTPPLLHQRSDMPCPKITSSS